MPLRRGSAFLLVPLVALGALMLAGADCGQRPIRCSFATDCPPDGRVYQCNEGICESILCETSGDCDLGAHCGVWTEEGLEQSQIPEGKVLPNECLKGCQREDDCLPGYYCLEDECTEKPCRNGHLDCGFCEICDGGECVPAGDPFCVRCSDGETVVDSSDPCNPVVLGHPTCLAGNACWPYEEERTCAVACESNSDCPGGMVCTDYFQYAPSCAGELRTLGRFCLGDCVGAIVCREGKTR